MASEVVRKLRRRDRNARRRQEREERNLLKVELQAQAKARRRLIADVVPLLNRYFADAERNEWRQAQQIMRRRSGAMFTMPIYAVKIGQVGVLRNEEEGTETPCYYYLDTNHRLRRTGGELGDHPRVDIENLKVWQLKKLIGLLSKGYPPTTA